MLITNPGTRAPMAQPHADVPPREGYHKQRSLAWENGDKVLIAPPPTADEIDQSLGWSASTGGPETEMRKAADLLGEIAAWFAASDNVHSAGLRAFALAVLLRGDMFCTGTLAGVAKELGVTKQAISKYVSELRRMSRETFVSPVCRRPSRKGQLATIAQHRRSGHRIHALKRKGAVQRVIAQICGAKK